MNWNMLWETPESASSIRIAAFVLLGFLALQVLAFAAARLPSSRQSPHVAQLLRKLIVYGGSLLIFITVLLELGFDLTGVLATAGLATVAIGFAAQTSLSNLISGLFLIGEKPFRIGDLIRTGGAFGVVESIDLLSTKIRTLDNLFVRIPNEAILKEPVTTITRYPIRRMDLDIGVAYKEDVKRVMEILRALATANRYALDDPEPLILFDRFGESALQFRFGLWFEKANYLPLRNSILTEIKERFDEEGIEIPFPHVTLYSGTASEAFPLEVRRAKGGSQR